VDEEYEKVVAWLKAQSEDPKSILRTKRLWTVGQISMQYHPKGADETTWANIRKALGVPPDQNLIQFEGEPGETWEDFYKQEASRGAWAPEEFRQ
jgi:hypothetical protein